MQINLVDEFSTEGHLIHAADFPGAYLRGKTRELALQKLTAEMTCYHHWLGLPLPEDGFQPVITAEKESTLKIRNADSDIILHSETQPLTHDEYTALKDLALRSASDFHSLYMSIPDHSGTVLTARKTFYGNVPLTAEEMYLHTMNVNSYYFGETGICAENGPDIYSCRMLGFMQMESTPDFLANTVYDGSYDEQWSLRKLCRRFVWHDRIHAKAMYRMAKRLCGPDAIADPFCFSAACGNNS